MTNKHPKKPKKHARNLARNNPEQKRKANIERAKRYKAWRTEERSWEDRPDA